MASKNVGQPFHLLWGGRGEDSLSIYKKYIKKHSSVASVSKSQNVSKTFQVAYSQNRKKTYVQDLLLKDQIEIANKFKEGTVFMICGSMAMQESVLETLEHITNTQLKQPLSDFENKGQLLMDCY
jgi:sulfite reductase (NADPH) flavoprotein alpha-component